MIFITVLAQAVTMVYFHIKDIVMVQPFEWYFWVSAIVGILYIWFVSVVMLESNKVKRRALSYLSINIVLTILNLWLLWDVPALFISSIVIVCIIMGLAWSLFRKAEIELSYQ